MRAVERTLARRLLLLGTPPGPAQPSLPWEEDETADAGGDGGILCCRGLVDEQEERAAIAHLLALARAAGPGAKIRWLTRALGRLREPAIVFTEYRDTVEALLDALPGTVRVASISGASPVDARAQAVAAFNGGLVDLLVATDAAGEGLNLHHRCRLVIDLELPWNPVRLEQRLGRVDRLGQRRRVHAIRLHHPDGIEARVLDRLRLRQRRAGLGDEPEPRSELEVARAIFDGAASEPEPPPAIQSASVPAARGEAARLSQQRRAAALPGADTTSAVWTQPQRTAATRLAVLHAVTVTNGFGAMVSELVHAHEVHACAPPARAGWRAIVESVRHSVRMRASLRTRSDRVRLDAERELGPIRTAVTARLAAIRERLARERAQALQRSLFDRRAEAGAAHADDVAGRHDMALALRQASVTSPVPRDGVAARLLAIWPLEPR
jgi:superfamily II DNA/RNA helicase